MVNNLKGVTLSKREQGFQVRFEDALMRETGNGCPLEGNRILPDTWQAGENQAVLS